MVGQINQVQSGILNNKLLGQQIGGKIALGQAITDATDPKTGKTDFQKAVSNLAQNPKGAFAMPEFSAQVLERALKENQVQVSDLDKTQKKMTAVGDLLLGVLAGKEPLTAEMMTKRIKEGLFDSGVLAEQDLPLAASFLQQLGDDPTKNRLAAMRLYTQTHANSEGLATLLGQFTNVDTGPVITPTRTSPVTGETQTGTPIAKGYTPEKLAELVEVIDPVTRAPKRVTLGSLLGIAPGDQSAAINTTGVQTGLAPGVAQAAGTAAEGSAQQAQELMVAADRVPINKGALNNIRDQLKTFTPGPKANWTLLIGQLAQQLGVATPKITEGVAGQEEFNKLATQFINAQVGALGGTGTDSKLDSAMKGTPNEFMSKMGIQNVTSLMLGLEDATAAKASAWQKWMASGKGAETYGQFQTQFNKLYDPRVFQAQYMTDKQRQLMLSGMTKDERTKFQNAFTFAQKAGWMGQ
jgi:hypothetical protein